MILEVYVQRHASLLVDDEAQAECERCLRKGGQDCEQARAFVFSRV